MSLAPHRAALSPWSASGRPRTAESDFVPHTCHFQCRAVPIGADSGAPKSRADQDIQHILAGPEVATQIFPKLRAALAWSREHQK